MGQDYYSVIIIADADRPARALHLPRWLGKAVLLGLAVCLAGLGFLFRHSADFGRQREELARLRQENARYRDTLDRVAGEVNKVQTRLEEISGFRARVVRMLGLPDARGGVDGRGGGIGAVGEDLDFIQVYKGKELELLQRLELDLGDMNQEVEAELGIHEGLSNFLRERAVLLRALPSIRPTEGGWVSSGFSRRRDPWTGGVRMHQGLDVAHTERAPVYATADGVVSVAHWDGGFGKIVEIDHGFGITTRYAHLSQIDAKLGERVLRGQRLGLLGETGRTTGRHLHYEVLLEGVPVDPMVFILDDVS